MDLIKFFKTNILFLLSYVCIVLCQECGIPYDNIRTTGFINGFETNIDKVSFWCIYRIRVIRTPSWLGPQETYFGRTLVIFGEKLSKNYSILGRKFAKINHSARPKNPKNE